MYLCVCNAISETHVRQAAENGTRSPSELYLALGCNPKCGKCVAEMRTLLLPRDESGQRPRQRRAP